MESIEELKLSYIVPVYNVSECLERCIDSILNQGISEQDYEILLINDGSTDSSPDICEKYSTEHSNIKYYSQQNQGLSVARNVGLQHALGKYIMFVDSDDFLEPNILEDVISTADSFKADLLFFLGKYFPDNKQIIRVQPFENRKVYTGEYVLLHGMSVGCVWANLYNRKFLEQSGIQFIPGIFSQDVDYNYRLYPKANRIVFSDFIVYNYVTNVESTTHTKNKNKLEKHVFDNLIVIRSVLNYASKGEISKELKSYYIKTMNSAFVGYCLLLLRVKSIYNENFAKRYIERSKELNLYPLKGLTKSVFTTLLLPIVNCKWLYLFLVKLFAR